MSRAAFAALALLSACGSADMRTVSVTDAFLVPGAGFAPGVLYARVENPGRTPDTLTAIESRVAQSVMLHANAADAAGRVSMTMIDHLVVPAQGTASLAPGGVHAMVDGLRAGIARGDTATVTFHFARAGAVASVARVIEYADVDSATAPRKRQ